MRATDGASSAQLVAGLLAATTFAVVSLAATAGGYECDPGRADPGQRAPCPGWTVSTDNNVTRCAVTLGCCWQRNEHAVAGARAEGTSPLHPANFSCYAPRQPTPSPPFPTITNPELQWLGFFGQAAGASGYDPVAQHTFSTFGCSSDFGELSLGARLNMTSLFRTQEFLVGLGNWNRSTPGPHGHRLFPDYRDRWAALAAQLRPWVRNGTVAGFHIGDELCLGGLPYTQLVAMSTMIANTSWGPGSPPRPLVLYCNEGMAPIVEDRNCFNETVGYRAVPPAIDWISFDFYNPPAAYIRPRYEQYLYPKMAPHQRALLVPAAQASAHLRPGAKGSPSGWAVPDMVARAREYFAWAATDASGRVIGLNPWHWKDLPFTPGDFWEVGVESIPPLRKVWTTIGTAVKANRREQQRVQAALATP